MEERPGTGHPFYEERYRRLEALGLADLNDWMSSPAVQITGRVTPEGVWFYFRARGGGASLEIFRDPPPHNWRTRIWRGEVDYDEQAHYHDDLPELDLPNDLIESLARELVAKWRAGELPLYRC